MSAHKLIEFLPVDLREYLEENGSDDTGHREYHGDDPDVYRLPPNVTAGERRRRVPVTAWTEDGHGEIRIAALPYDHDANSS